MNEMHLELEFVNERKVRVIAVEGEERHEVGRVFAPADGKHGDALQICGFSEAFDFWGCGAYAVREGQEQKETPFGIIAKDIYRQRKDIQLKFEWNTEPHRVDGDLVSFNPDNCLGCYHKPCVCEKPQGKGDAPFDSNNNPYVVKREKDIYPVNEKVE